MKVRRSGEGLECSYTRAKQLIAIIDVLTIVMMSIIHMIYKEKSPETIDYVSHFDVKCS